MIGTGQMVCTGAADRCSRREPEKVATLSSKARFGILHARATERMSRVKTPAGQAWKDENEAVLQQYNFNRTP